VIDSRNDPGDESVEFFATGIKVAGQYRCAECGYGITIHAELPVCPMCSGRSWEATPWTPLSSSAAFPGARSRSSGAAL